MSRQIRIEYPGAVYHVYARGNARQDIFLDDEDRLSFLGILASVNEVFNWLCHADCLMNHHFHLEIETPDGNLSAGMRILNGTHAQRFNRRHGRVGKLFQGRFGAKLVQKEAYLLELCRYIVLNPVRAGMVSEPGSYRWSSYRSTAGLEEAHPSRTADWVLSQFGDSRTKAQLDYRQFIAEGAEAKVPAGEIIIGDKKFTAERIALLDADKIIDLPRKQRFAYRPSIQEIISLASDRNEAIALAVLKHGYKQCEVAEAVGLKYARVSQILSSMRQR